MKSLLRSLPAALLAMLFAAHSTADDAPQRLPAVTLSAGMFNIRAEVARTPKEREIGLMFRPQMGPQEGMLFVFEQPAEQCFWMKNTLLPLSAAFLADDGTVVNIEHMKPQTLDSHCSARPVRYVLEMNQGWFEQRGIKPGSRIVGAPLGEKDAGKAAGK